MVAERDGNSFYDEFSTGTYLGMANGGWKPDCLLFYAQASSGQFKHLAGKRDAAREL